MPREPVQRRPSLGAIFLTVFLDLLGFGLVFPFLAKEARDSFGVTAFTATLLGSAYSAMQFLFVPVWGRLSDRIGRRPVLLWSIAGTSLSMLGLGVGLAYGSSIAWLFAARVFSGIATANLGTASAYIADITKPEERAKGMGMIGMAFGLGFILGPGVGGVLAKIPFEGRHGVWPCFLAAAMSAINFVWASLGLAESLPPEVRATKAKRSLSPINLVAMKESLARPGFALAVGVNFIVILSFTSLDQTFTFFCGDLLGIDEAGTGIALALVGVVAAAVQGGLIRPLSRRFSDAALVRAGVFFQVFAFAGLAASGAVKSLVLLALACAFLAFGNGLSQPSTSAFVSKTAPATEQGSALGTNQSFASLARTFGPALGGWLYGSVNRLAPYSAAAVGMVIAVVMASAMKGNAPGAKT